MPVNVVHASKFLSFGAAAPSGNHRDKDGWADVDALLFALSIHDMSITLEDLVMVVETSKKRRFPLNSERTRIRASQGHSIAVELGYRAAASALQ